MKITSLKLSGVDQSELAEQIPSDMEYSDIVSRDEDIGIDPIEHVQDLIQIQHSMCFQAGMNLNIVLYRVLLTIGVANRWLSGLDSEKSGCPGEKNVTEHGSCMNIFIFEQAISDMNLTDSAITAR